jgi:hypothetical protein
MTLWIKQSTRAGVWAALLALLVTSPAPAEAQARYVDGASTCPARTGASFCSTNYRGPFRKIGEGVKWLAPGGTLFIRGTSYTEPILLNKRMQIAAYDGPATIVGPSPLAPFDLVADTVDDNGLPLNPRWGGQRNTGSPPDPRQCPRSEGGFNLGGHYHDPSRLECSHQYAYPNYPDLASALVCDGKPHVNWFGVTYSTPSESDVLAPTQTVSWDSNSCGPDDWDYNININRGDKAGYVIAGTRDWIHTEFDLRETINHFTTPWWSKFHDDVNKDGCGTTGPRATEINGSAAIVTGLMGFDAFEDVSIELHPVWALAMNVNPQGSTSDDTWVFFVRNWGNEGSCGASQEYIDFPNNQYTFRIPWNLPWRAGATSATVISKDFNGYHTQNPPPSEENGSIRIVPGVGIFVTFALDAPRQDGSVWDGELHLQWIGGPWTGGGGGGGGGACCPSGKSCCGGCDNGTCSAGCIAAGQHCP